MRQPLKHSCHKDLEKVSGSELSVSYSTQLNSDKGGNLSLLTNKPLVMQRQFMPHSHTQNQTRFGQRYSVPNALIPGSNKRLQLTPYSLHYATAFGRS
jgi:hypothetical protein